ncbi:cytochrome P450 714C2-like [Alnus glutinosa]|uniref:cytochrome P450 714C2-like n=1 Tax=Alnus glutinosa TaxID=3517 RepID=UPI002D766346|nr:cytochrome P450 714C2-like [Alnus glutinosa]
MEKISVSVILGALLLLLVHLYNLLILKPKVLRGKLQRQGIRGPSPSSFLFGNIPEMKRSHLRVRSTVPTTAAEDSLVAIAHDWPSTVFPHLVQWRNEYGPIFLYSTGSIQLLCITDTEMVKEISLCTSLSLGKPSYLSKDRGPLLGRGILSSSGPIWAHQRKTIAPELYIDKVKGMVNLMLDSTSSMLRTWESRVENEGGVVDIKIDEDLRSLSADILSRACFGSDYAQGEQIFLKLESLQKIMSNSNVGIPGFRFLPSKHNRAIWKVEKEINSMILKVVKQRIEASSDEKDLLQMILEGAKSHINDTDGLSIKFSPDKFMVDNCKNIYFAGQETTSITTSWCLMLLAAHPDWQARARAEVLQICEDRVPDANMLRNMKTLTMVIHETLRLFPPAAFLVRAASEDITFKDIMIPKGINLQIPIAMLHRQYDMWGPDAHKFNPERFARGIAGACKTPQAYMPFGVGSRVCVGQHFAMTELKVILSLILSKFCFSLSPAYHHSPTMRLVILPEHGVIIHLRKL